MSKAPRTKIYAPTVGPSIQSKPTEEFVALRALWYRKLAAEGFKELEFFHADGIPTNQLLRDSLGSLMENYRPESEYYYRKARWYGEHNEFVNSIDKTIWCMHADGQQNPAIGKVVRWSKERVRKAVIRLRAAMLADKRYERIEAEEIAAEVARLWLRRIK